MKRAARVVAISAGILLFLSAGAWAQPVPAAARSATGQKSASAKEEKPEKPKKWHGQLVGATCMEKTLHRRLPRSPSLSSMISQQAEHAATSQANLPPRRGQELIIHQETVVGRSIGGEAPWGAADAAGNGPSINTAAMERAARLEHAAKQCTATSTTSQFGLLTDSGAVMKFGKSGNSKASEAVKQVELEPQKPVEATVRGLEGSKGRFLVTSVAVKGRHKK